MSYEPVVALVGKAEEYAGRDFAPHPALGAEHRGPNEPAEDPGPRSHVDWSLQAGAATDLGSLIQHDRAIPAIEHHAGLDVRTQGHEVSGIAQDHAPDRHPVVRRREEVGAVSDQKLLQRSKQVKRAAQKDAFDRDLRSLGVRTVPALTGGDHPADSLACVDEPASGPGIDWRSRRREPCRTDDCRPVDRAHRPHGRLVAIAKPGDM